MSRLVGSGSVPLLAGHLAVAESGCDVQLVVHALGSCVGVAIYDPRVGVGGLLHALLPESAADPERARRAPATFADSGVVALVKEFVSLGGNPRSCRTALVGGASRADLSDRFRVGRRNVLSARRALLECGLLLDAEDVGGVSARTLSLRTGTGEIVLAIDRVPRLLVQGTRLPPGAAD